MTSIQLWQIRHWLVMQGIPETVFPLACAFGVSMGLPFMLVQVAGQLCAEGEGSHSCGQVYDALVGSKVPGSEQLGGAAGHQSPVRSKHQAGKHRQRQQEFEACYGYKKIDDGCADRDPKQYCRPARNTTLKLWRFAREFEQKAVKRQ